MAAGSGAELVRGKKMAKLTPLQKASAIAGIIAAVVGVLGVFKWNNGQSVKSGTDNVQGNVRASRGSVSVGHGSSVNIVSSIGNPEAERGGVRSEVSLFLECNFGTFPTVISRSGKNYFMEIRGSSGEYGGDGLAYFFGPAGSTAGFGPGQLAYECNLINYGATPLFNVQVPLGLTFKEARTVPGQPNARQIGAIRSHREWPIVIPKIDAGRDNPFAFYIKSTSPDFVDVRLPQNVTLQQGGNQATITVRLILPLNPSFTVNPDVPNLQ